MSPETKKSKSMICILVIRQFFSCLFYRKWIILLYKVLQKYAKKSCSVLRKKCPTIKCKEQLLRRYPVGVDVSAEDPDSIEVHKRAISDELTKSKPRDSVLLPLLKSIYHERRLFIENEATSIKQIIENYPALSRRPIVRINFLLQPP